MYCTASCVFHIIMYKCFRGNYKSYYEDFIVSNEKVDTHVAEIGYESDVIKCSKWVL